MMRNPAHPGELIRDEVLPSFGLTISKAVEILGVSRPNFNHMLNGKRSLTPDMALRIEKAFGVSSELLMSMQARHDLAQARLESEEIIASIQPQKMVQAVA